MLKVIEVVSGVLTQSCDVPVKIPLLPEVLPRGLRTPDSSFPPANVAGMVLGAAVVL